MANEAQRQQQLIDSGLLDSLGDVNLPLELGTVEGIFVKYMGILVERMHENLNKLHPVMVDGRQVQASSVASGALTSSIRFEYKVVGQSYIGEVYMTDYADFVDKGVQGIGPGNRNNTSPYKFKTMLPSKNMKDALVLWIRQKNITDKIDAPTGLFGRETASRLSTVVKEQSLATAIGIGIKRHGIQATNFKTVSVESIMADLRRDLAAAAATDIAININTSLN